MKLKTLALLLITCGSSASYAASNLRDAVEQTVLRNPEVRAKWLSFRAAGNEQDVARGNYYPKIDVLGYAGVERQDRPKTSSESFSHPGVSLELRQMLFDGFATRDEVRRLGYGKLTRYYDLLAASDAAALETTNAYLDVKRYRQLVALASENFAIHQETFNQIQERVTAGVGRRVDLETASGRLALAESNWLTESSNLHDVSARYERLTGTIPQEQMTEVPNFADKVPQNLTELKERVAYNPAFRASVYNIRAARADAQSKKSTFYPQFEVRASQGYELNRDNIDGSFKDGKIQLVMNYNLFRGGSDTARVSQYAEQFNIAQEMRDKTCRDIRQTTQIAWNDTYRLKEQLKYLDQHVLSTEKARDAFRKQFDLGQRSLLDVLDTENELFEAKRSLVRAEYDHRLSYARVLTQSHQLLSALQISPLENTSPDNDLGDNLAEDEAINCSGALIAAVPLNRAAAIAAHPARVVEPLPTPVATTPSTATSCDKSVTDFIENWRTQWSGKKADEYLALYSSQFDAGSGRTRADWEAKRRTRLNKEGDIKLSVEKFSCTNVSKDRADVTFKQNYSSNNNQDVVEKTLELVQDGGKWKIKRERVTSGRAE
nr:TolC family outer membrane protein [uncultured Deefgea sp.]